MLRVENISFAYNKTLVLKQLNFTVKQGEHLSVIGESGSGKSTLLKLIYGEYDLNEGQLFWKNQELLGPKYNLVVGYDFIKSVTQEFDLMPYITVAENVGKYLSNTNPTEKQLRIHELLEVVELTNYANTKAKLLSGGQKQRIAIAKALAKQPELLLLDEPFSHIDNFKKQSLRRKIFSYLKRKQITCIVATHNHEDVLGYADTLLVLHHTKIADYGSPKEIYKHPKSSLIASFFGEFNQLDGYGFVYAHQLKLVEKSAIETIVMHSYFKGNYFLIQVNHHGNFLFFEHPTAITENETVFLKVDKESL